MLTDLKLIFSIITLFSIGFNEISTVENVGCLFSEDLCEVGEICFDDNAFGRCEGINNVNNLQIDSTYQHSLDGNTLRLLEKEMQRLFLSGYRWDHEYTQCVIKQILYTHRLRITYDPGLCSRLLRLAIPNIPPETSIDLSLKTNPYDMATIEFTPDRESNFANEVFLPIHQKNNYPVGNNKRNSDKETTDEKIFSYLRKLVAEAESDAKDSKYDVFPDKNLPVMEIDLSSDLNQKPVYSEGGVEWLPVDNDNEDNTRSSQKSIADTESQSNDGDVGADGEERPINNELDLSQYLKPSVNDYENDLFRSLINDDNDNEVDLNNDDIISARSFPRQHRYDTKKPGPSYYIHEIDSDETENLNREELNRNTADYEIDEFFNTLQTDDKKNNKDEKSDDETELEDLVDQLVTDKSIGQKEQVRYGDPSAEWSYSEDKKDNSYRAYKPVSEGPVKLDAKSKDSIVVRPAENGEDTSLEAIDSSYTYVILNKQFGEKEAHKFVEMLEQLLKLPTGTFSNVRKDKDKAQVTFKVNPNRRDLNASQIAAKIEDMSKEVKSRSGFTVVESGIGDKTKLEVVSNQVAKASVHRLTTLTLTLCGVIMAALVSGVLVFLYRRNAKFREKLRAFTSRPDVEASLDYQDLCRQRMQNKSNEKSEAIQVAPTTGTGVHSTSKLVSKLSQQSSDGAQQSPSRSSTSSWSEEPVASNMDISTGHIILSYMEDHLKKKDRLDREWEALCAYEADPCSTNAANLPQNAKKNRYPDILPYDHSRVILNDLANISGSDYINANTITDHDPRNPAYIATQGPLPNTTADFWQMVWEQGSVIIVMLTRLMENGVAMCHRYWPEEGSEVYHTYEVHLVSEHIWCDDYLVRSFYLKNLKTSETRTVTQFHFLSWPENGVPPNAKSILEFRRKVNKSYRGRSCPIVAHCSDGTGRTGTYALIDMVLNRMSKGAKEIDIAATLEHIRDQRLGMVKTKAQFEYVLTAVAEEVQAILKALGQN
jgi:receptor-type tyrosine-protein phosphatase N